MEREEKGGLLSKLKRVIGEVTYGAALHGQVSAVLKTRMYIEHMFILMILGDMLGFPILPPYYSLRLLPYAVPNVQSWKHRFYRERDFTDVIYG